MTARSLLSFIYRNLLQINKNVNPNRKIGRMQKHSLHKKHFGCALKLVGDQDQKRRRIDVKLRYK